MYRHTVNSSKTHNWLILKSGRFPIIINHKFVIQISEKDIDKVLIVLDAGRCPTEQDDYIYGEQRATSMGSCNGWSYDSHLCTSCSCIRSLETYDTGRDQAGYPGTVG